MANEPKTAFKWHHPQKVMQLHQLKRKKSALQERINSKSTEAKSKVAKDNNAFKNLLAATKRRNPFINNSDSKRTKRDTTYEIDESADSTLFKLLHCTSTSANLPNKENVTSFTNVLSQANEAVEVSEPAGTTWFPVDWTLKTKIRFMSPKPFAWSQKLKISEQASGITSFTRCLDTGSTATSLDTSSNAKFHQCCLYWQHPNLPWVNLFPRTTLKASIAGASVASNSEIRTSLQGAWTDSLRSVFHLIRTRQCPYFYVCSNSFTVLFRAAGMCGFNEMHALVTPTTRGFRNLLKVEEIQFEMPLKRGRYSDQGYETQDSTNSSQVSEDVGELSADEDGPDEVWLHSMGINADDIKKINYTQERIEHRAECEVDNSEQSLVIIKAVEVSAFYNFLINCKSVTALTGPLAGIPPTILAPVAFQGASLNALKVRESKVHVDDADYFSIELSGPVLPDAVHNMFAIHCPEHSLSATFANLKSTAAFGKVKFKPDSSASEPECDTNVMTRSGSAVFKKENLSDCGFNPKILQHFCSEDPLYVTNVECLKYSSDSRTYTWT